MKKTSILKENNIQETNKFLNKSSLPLHIYYNVSYINTQ